MNAPSHDFCNRAIAYLIPIAKAAKSEIEVSQLDAPILTKLDNGLLVGYLVDQGGHFEYVQRRHLAEAKLTETDLHRNSVNNLAMLLAEQGAKVYPTGETFTVIFGGNFEASLILVDALWDQHLAHLAPNGFIVAIPTRDLLIFCDAKSAAGVDTLHRDVERFKGGDHPITSTLYCRVPPSRIWRRYQDAGSSSN